MYDLIIKNATVVNEDTAFVGDIGVLDGRISQMSSGMSAEDAKEVIDASGMTVIPGAIDMHVHFNDPGRTEWETWENGTKGAAAGGITTVVDMPLNSLPEVTNTEALKAKRERASANANVDYVLYGGVVDDNLAEIPAMVEQGLKCFKAFMSDSGVEYTVAHDGILFEAFRMLADTDCFISAHAENNAMLKFYKKRLVDAGRKDPMAWEEARPPIVEMEAINRFLFLAKMTGAKAHVCHISVGDGFDLVAQAKSTGVRATAETCAHYLYFSSEDVVREGPALKCAPPVRDAENRETLWRHLLSGDVDTVTSDHCPCTVDLKHLEANDIFQGWAGAGNIQATIPVLLTEGFHKRGMPLSRLVQLMCANPARILGVYGKKGVIRPGADADLVLIEPDREWTMTEADVRCDNKLNGYLGRTFIGYVNTTIVRGKTVLRNGETISANGWGQEIKND